MALYRHADTLAIGALSREGCRRRQPDFERRNRMTDQPLTIERQEAGSKGRYFLRDGSGALAEMTFSRAGEKMIIIDHTEVPDAFRGQGIGRRLVERAVADARAEGRTIMPLCPFAKAQFLRHPDWSDVLKR